MEMAFAEANRVKGKTLPNPAVGAVLVKAGKVIAKGGTGPAGQAHAEIAALKAAGAKAKGSTLYVTLEPCSHHGKTPPCVDALIKAGVSEVVAPVKDSNPLVGGKGIAALEKAGIKVRIGLMREEAEAFYAGFFFAIANKRPKIILKIAQSLDGRINHGPDEETPITGEEARAWTHGRRALVDAVIVSGKTLRADNPDLTPRLIKGAAAPEALVLSRRGPFPSQANLFNEGRTSRTIVIGESREDLPAWVEHVRVGEFANKADLLAALLALFAKRGYHSVLVEGGRELWGLFLNADVVDQLFVITAPRFLPGGDHWDSGLAQDWGNSLKFRNLTPLGSDFLSEFGRSGSAG